jgi:hypothetical protein
MTAGGVTVRLTWFEVWETANCGAARYMLAAQADRDQRYGEVAANRWHDIEGAWGERVLASSWGGSGTAPSPGGGPGTPHVLEAGQSILQRGQALHSTGGRR